MEWNFIDDCAIFCINLKSRPDRLVHATREFEKIGLHSVEFYHPTKSAVPGEGCWLSHKRCMALALQRPRVKNILILEDDIEFEDFSISQYQTIKKAYTNGEWNILYIGALPLQLYEEIIPGIWTGLFVHTTAYFIKAEYATNLLTNPKFIPSPKLQHIDAYYAIYSNKHHLVYPQIAWQYDNVSDNTWGYLQLLFQNSFLYKFNQRLINFAVYYVPVCDIIKKLVFYVMRG